jgi:hypothetical protein
MLARLGILLSGRCLSARIRRTGLGSRSSRLADRLVASMLRGCPRRLLEGRRAA